MKAFAQGAAKAIVAAVTPLAATFVAKVLADFNNFATAALTAITTSLGVYWARNKV